MKTKQLPKELLAQWFVEGDERYILAHESALDAAESDVGETNAGEYVGVYELKRIVRLSVITSVKETPVRVKP